MSSHHFVREGQEPALIIVEAIEYGVVAALLEWSPLVVVMEDALEKALTWGIKIDVVIVSDAAIASVVERLAEQAPVKLLTYEEGVNSLKIVYDFLAEKGQKRINIIVEKIKPFIHFDNTALMNAFEVTLITSHLKWSLVHKHFKKWFAAMTTIEVITTTTDQPITFVNLTWENLYCYVSTDGIIEILSDIPFWAGEPL